MLITKSDISTLNSKLINNSYVYYAEGNSNITIIRSGRFRTLSIWNTPATIVNTIVLINQDHAAEWQLMRPILHRGNSVFTTIELTSTIRVSTENVGNIHGSITYIASEYTH